MPDSIIPTDSSGYPYLDEYNLVQIVPEYTRRLKDFLAGRINALTAAAASGTIPKGPSAGYVLAGDLTWRKIRDHHRALLRRAGDQIIPNDQWTRVEYNGANTLDGSVTYDTGARELVLGAPGLWLINEIHHWVGASASGPLESRIMLNGGMVAGTLMSNNLNSAFSQSISHGLVTTNTTSRLRTEVSTRNGSTRALYGANDGFTSLEAIHLGPVVT